MIDLSKFSWYQLKKISRQLQREIQRREQKNPTIYRCGQCLAFHGNKESVIKYMKKNCSCNGKRKRDLIPIWR